MSIIDLKELVENYAFKFFKDSERSYYKKFGKAVGWRELSKEIDWKNFRYLFIQNYAQSYKFYELLIQI